MLAADHICAERRGFGGRAMPEAEKPPARPEDNYSGNGQFRAYILQGGVHDEQNL